MLVQFTGAKCLFTNIFTCPFLSYQGGLKVIGIVNVSSIIISSDIIFVPISFTFDTFDFQCKLA